MTLKLIDYQIIQNQEILFNWEDDHRSLISAFELRLACPCAQCIDEMTGRKILRPEKIVKSIGISEVLAVGRYAVRFLFTDAHHTGIYSYEYLRTLCLCPTCVEKRKNE